MKVVEMQRPLRMENNMVRWMSGVTLKDRRTCEELNQGLGIESVDRVVSRCRLRWYGHVKRKNADDWVYKCRHLEVVGGGWHTCASISDTYVAQHETVVLNPLAEVFSSGNNEVDA